VLPSAPHASMFPVAALGPMHAESAAEYADRMGVELPRPPRLPAVGALT